MILNDVYSIRHPQGESDRRRSERSCYRPRVRQAREEARKVKRKGRPEKLMIDDGYQSGQV
jgi:hypothetical protein